MGSHYDEQREAWDRERRLEYDRVEKQYAKEALELVEKAYSLYWDENTKRHYHDLMAHLKLVQYK
jgi:hypothetical protein